MSTSPPGPRNRNDLVGALARRTGSWARSRLLATTNEMVDTSTSASTFIDPGLANVERLIRPPRPRRSCISPAGVRPSTSSEDYIDPCLQQLKVGQLANEKRARRQIQDNGWKRPEMSLGSAAADVIFGVGPMDVTGARARHTPRTGWQPVEQTLFAEITAGAAGSAPPFEKRRSRGVSRGERVHAHSMHRGPACADLPAGASSAFGSNLEAMAAPIVSLSAREREAGESTWPERDRAHRRAPSPDGRRRDDDHFAGGSSMEMAADAPQAPTVRQKPARIGARAGRKYSDHFDGSSCCVSAASASSSPAASRGGRLLLPNVPHLAIERLSGVGSAPPHALPSQPLARSAGGTDCHGGGTGAGTGAVEYGADGWGADGWGDLRSTYRSAAGGPLDSIVPGHSAPSDDRRVGGVDLGGGGAPSNTAGDVAMYRPTHAHELQPIGAVENGGAPLWIAAERPTGHGSSTSQHASPGALGACASVGGYSGADDDVHRALSGQRHALSPRPAGASIACPRGGSSSPAIYRSHISRTSPARRRSHGGESTADLLYMDSCAPDAKPPDDLHRTTPRTPWLGVYSAPHRATFSGRSARALLRGADGDNGGGGDDVGSDGALRVAEDGSGASGTDAPPPAWLIGGGGADLRGRSSQVGCYDSPIRHDGRRFCDMGVADRSGSLAYGVTGLAEAPHLEATAPTAPRLLPRSASAPCRRRAPTPPRSEHDESPPLGRRMQVMAAGRRAVPQYGRASWDSSRMQAILFGDDSGPALAALRRHTHV